jgi:hypothetical protein
MKPTPAELLATAQNLIRAAERLLQEKKPAPRAPRRRKPRRTVSERPLTQEELRAAFAEMGRSLEVS